MIGSIFKLFSGRPAKRFLKRAQGIVAKINAIEKQYQDFSEEALKAKTEEFKARFQKGESLDDLLPEAFATVKNAARRLCGTPVNVCEHELTWNMIHYDVQLIGGIALHEGKISEMATGEGKTLVATLPLYLNALSGRNCQLITVNDYLVKRDSEWMGHLYRFLGLTVGCIQNSMRPQERILAYNADITYGTASEFGFDYLRDNGMATRREDQVQRDHFFCIIDEVDSILIDEARTPLIISGPAMIERPAPFADFKAGVANLVELQHRLCSRLANEAKDILEKTVEGDVAREGFAKLLQVKLGMPKNRTLMRLMENGNIRKKLDRFEIEMHADFQKKEFFALKEALYFSIDEKHHQADLSEIGRETLRPDNPQAFMLPDLPTYFMELDRDESLSVDERQTKKDEAEAKFMATSEEIHCLSQLLRAYCLYEKDVAYVVQEDRVMIVDENTGRVMPGRRWSDGLHQAIEAKEGVEIQEETRTYATITLQNYFRLYKKLAGMTGTAETEASEFYDIYKLEVIPMPTHRPCIRKDQDDIIYRSRREKYAAILQLLKEIHTKGQPVLVGTTSVESSEVLSKMLKRENIPHNILNAKNHAKEADIVAEAGQKGAVTIATNMAGRGTDIKLGEGVSELGGLFVLGTERHESRRIDRQLRGRCSRQGDPGMSQFYISLEDDLMRLFASAGPIGRILENSFAEGEALTHPLLNRSIQSAQKRVEEQNYAMRKRLIKYDDVLNRQREVIYSMRNGAIRNAKPEDLIFEVIADHLDGKVQPITEDTERPLFTKTLEEFLVSVNHHFPVELKIEDFAAMPAKNLVEQITAAIRQSYAEQTAGNPPQMMESIVRQLVIRPIDRHWQDHLTEMEELRRSVNLRSYGQKDPLNEYKKEAFKFFEAMVARVYDQIAMSLGPTLKRIELIKKLEVEAEQMKAPAPQSNALPFPKIPNSLPGVTDPKQQQSAAAFMNMMSAAIEARKAMAPCSCGSNKPFSQCCGAKEKKQ